MTTVDLGPGYNIRFTIRWLDAAGEVLRVDEWLFDRNPFEVDITPPEGACSGRTDSELVPA